MPEPLYQMSLLKVAAALILQAQNKPYFPDQKAGQLWPRAKHLYRDQWQLLNACPLHTAMSTGLRRSRFPTRVSVRNLQAYASILIHFVQGHSGVSYAQDLRTSNLALLKFKQSLISIFQIIFLNFRLDLRLCCQCQELPHI